MCTASWRGGELLFKLIAHHRYFLKVGQGVAPLAGSDTGNSTIKVATTLVDLPCCKLGEGLARPGEPAARSCMR